MSEIVPSDAHDHALMTGDGTKPALPATKAPPRRITRKLVVKTRGPFLPAHHNHFRHALKPHQD